jgi:heme/copper-type cytochrome/quinol oxidase subunit 1
LRLEDLTDYPRRMVLASVFWFYLGGAAGITMLLLHLTRLSTPPLYYQLMTLHGFAMPFGGLFQLMMGLSLLRAGFCYGKPVKGRIVELSYILLNAGMILVLLAVAMGARTSYTLMFPLPAAGALRELWPIEAVTVLVWGVVMVVSVIVALYPAALARLIFTGKTQEALVLERFMGTLNPSGMASMLPYVFIIPPVGAAISLAAVAIGIALLGIVPLSSVGWALQSLNFNYPFWVFAHNLMEAMGVMAIGTVYWLVPRYTVMERGETGVRTLFSEKLGLLAIVFYSTAAIMAFPHHLFTMPTSQPQGLSYTGQIASWLTGFGAAFSVFNVLATSYAFGLRLTPASLAAMLGFGVYVADGFLAMQLGTIGWAYRLHGTYAATAHLMTILLAVTLIWIGALYHSFQLLFGRPENRKLAYIHIVATAVAALGLLYTMAAMGGLGIPRRAYPLPTTDHTTVAVLTLFASILASGQIAFLLQLTRPKTTKT